jgi:hypothetical protein
MPQEVVNAVDEVVRRLQDEFEAVNTYGKNDNVENERARTRINAELKKVINQAVNARATFGILGKDTKSWNDGAVQGDVEAMKRMFNLDNVDKDDNVSVYFDDNLKLTFRVVDHITRGGFGPGGFNQETYGDVSYNMDQLRKNIPEVNLKADGVIFDTLTSVEKQAKTAGTKGVNNWSEEEVNSIFAKQIQTKEDFTNLAFRRIEDIHEQSFRTNLVENMNVAISTMDATFQGMFESMDIVKDGNIDSKDLASLSGSDLAIFKSNYKKMIDVLTDVDDDDFNLERSKNLLAGYFTGFTKQKYDKAYQEAVKSNQVSLEGGVNKKIGNSLITPSTWNESYVPYIDFLENPVEGSRTQSPRGLDVIYQGGVFKKEVDGKWIEQSVSDLASIDYISKYVKGGNIAVNTTVEVNTTPVPLPIRSITSRNFKENRKEIISELGEFYVDFPGFKFEYYAGMLKITAPDGKTTDNVKMNRLGSANMVSQTAIQKFIQDNINGNGNKIEW